MTYKYYPAHYYTNPMIVSDKNKVRYKSRVSQKIKREGLAIIKKLHSQPGMSADELSLCKVLGDRSNRSQVWYVLTYLKRNNLVKEFNQHKPYIYTATTDIDDVDLMPD